MKALFSLVSLVVVLCIVTVTVQRQLRAARLADVAGGASAPFGGTNRPTPAQYQQELHRALDAGMATRAAQSESAAVDH